MYLVMFYEKHMNWCIWRIFN